MASFVKKHIKLLITIALIIAGILLYYFVISPTQASKVDTATVKRGTLEEKLTISGQIAAEEHAILQFQTGGQLAWVGVKVGDYVTKYQSIASLDQRQIQKTLQKYLNLYLSNRQDFDQTKDDNKDKVLTDALKRTLIKSQTSLDNTVLDLEINDLAKQFGSLWTPIEGIVVRVDTPYAGVNIVSPALAQFEVVNPNTIHFVAQADQTEVINFQQGQKGKLSLDAFPDKTIVGNIKEIAFTPAANQTSTVYDVKFIFPVENLQNKYKLSMTGDLTFVTGKKENVLYLPGKFVKNDNGKKVVTVRKNGKDEKVPVKTGLETDSDIEIKSGVGVGQIVVDIK